MTHRYSDTTSIGAVSAREHSLTRHFPRWQFNGVSVVSVQDGGGGGGGGISCDFNARKQDVCVC